jgi:hypothetical protein
MHIPMSAYMSCLHTYNHTHMHAYTYTYTYIHTNTMTFSLTQAHTQDTINFTKDTYTHVFPHT